jgi:hypothetical protein
MLGALSATAPTAQADMPKLGDLLGGKFALVAATPDREPLCDGILGVLNQPTIYDPNDLHSSLLLTSATRVWQIVDGHTGRRRPANTFGEYRARENHADVVEADLDHDGVAEDAYRIWLQVKGQTYTEVSLSDDGTRQPATLATLTHALQDIGRDPPDSSFFLIDILDVEDVDYLVALEIVEPGIERHNRLAYAAHLRENRRLAIDCVLKTTLFED